MLEGGKLKLNHKLLDIVALDGRRLYIETSDVAFINTEMDDDGHVMMISLEDKITILKGDRIQVTLGRIKTVYKVSYMIVDKKGKSVILYSSTPTKSELFLLPLLGKTAKQLKHSSYFVSAQLDNTYGYLCLKYRFTGTEAYKDFEKYMMTDPLFISHLEHGKHEVVYIFNIPSRFKKDVVSFVEGKYSKFSKALINQIRKFHDAETAKPLIDIINRNESLKMSMEEHLGVRLPENAELASIPDLKLEIYKPYDDKN